MDCAHQMSGRGPFPLFPPFPPSPPFSPPPPSPPHNPQLNKLMSGPSMIFLSFCSIESKLLSPSSFNFAQNRRDQQETLQTSWCYKCFPKQLLIYIQKNDDLLDRGYKYSLQHPLSLACSKQNLYKQNKLLFLLLKKRNDRNIAECLQPD